MTIHDTLFKLATLGDCSAITPELREAVKEAARVIAEVRNLCSLPASAEVKEITPAVRSWVIGGMGHAFHRDYIVTTVANLSARNEELATALIDIDEQRHAAPLEDERRIILASLEAAKVVYGSTYFDTPAQVEG